MKTDVSIRLDLPTHLASALELYLREQLRQRFQEHWYSDEFRLVAEKERSQAIIAAYPAVAAKKKTLGALQAALSETA